MAWTLELICRIADTCILGSLILLSRAHCYMCQAERVQLVPKAGHKVVVEWDQDIWRPEVGQLQAVLYGDCQLMPELSLVEICKGAYFASAVTAFAMRRTSNILIYSDPLASQSSRHCTRDT